MQHYIILDFLSDIFPLGSLLYKINSRKKLFKELSDGEVQLQFSNGDFPDNIISLQLWPINPLYYSLEFSKEVEKIGRSFYHFYCLEIKL